MAICSAHIPLAAPCEQDPEVTIDLLRANDERREAVEQFVQLVFQRAYGAKVTHFLPYLLGMRQREKIIAALGLRPAGNNMLFLENYLEKPIENVLAEKLARPIDRKRVIEVGNLASIRGGSTRALIVALTGYLYGAGYEWTVFTATSQVRNNFAKLGIHITYLADAEKTRLGEAQHDWGNYYDQSPQLMVGNTQYGAGIILQAIKSRTVFPHAMRLWTQAYIAGQTGRLSLPTLTTGPSPSPSLPNNEKVINL